MVTKASLEILMKLTTLPIILVIGAMSSHAAQKDLDRTDRFPAAEGKIVQVDAADLDLRVRAADVEFIEANTLLHIGGTGDDKAQRWIDNHTPVFTDGEEHLEIVVEPGKSGFLGFGSLSAKATISPASYSRSTKCGSSGLPRKRPDDPLSCTTSVDTSPVYGS